MSRLFGVAILLLPHLVKTMHRTGSVVVPCYGIAVGQLERTREKSGIWRRPVHPCDARIGNLAGQARSSRGQELIVVHRAVWETIFGRSGVSERANPVIRASACGTSVQGRWEFG